MQEGDNIIGRRCVGNVIDVPIETSDMSMDRRHCKGYYDRLLPRIPSAYKAGICFPFQLVEEVPAEPFDIRMDEIITQ